ncbi:MAG: M13 family metallopeptidase [Gemmatimonadota bacterium]|nr:M13 family metallopeptidase [Gemmatimonadota bacterium]
MLSRFVRRALLVSLSAPLYTGVALASAQTPPRSAAKPAVSKPPQPPMQQPAVKALNRANLDTTCAACKDFYQYANGGWLKKNKIPDDKSNLGSFGMLGDKNQEVVQKIVADDANRVRDFETKPGTNEWKIGTFYLSCMDTAAMQTAGFKPIKPTLDAIAAAKTTDDVVKLFAIKGTQGGGRGGGGGMAPFGIGPSTDPKNSQLVILSANQGGLTLSRDDYLSDNERAVKRRADYVDHVARTLALLGESASESKAQATSILALETAIAKVSLAPADMRDPQAMYHKMTLPEFEKTTPHLNLSRYLQQQGAKTTADVNVRVPKFFVSIDSIVAAEPVENWKAYLRWHTVDGAMSSLSAPFRAEAFRWQQITSGVKVAQARTKLCASATSTALGEAVGEEWVKRNFTPEAKARATKMVDNLVSALRDRINGLDWMSAPTKAQAVTKLNAFLRKVAYPDKWRDYSAMQIKTGSYYENEKAVGEWNSTRSWARVGKVPDRTEWSMTPPTVNASYSSSLNQIQFPAGILQPPFFDPNADDAVNYGALGAVIGHEMSHGFDDSGRQFDAAGNLRDWWTPEDAAKYKVAAQRVVDQFNGFTVVDDKSFVNGRLTQGENIADLGGLTVGYAALQKALAGKPHSKIDGFTPEQRFFLAWAQIWRGLSRPEAELQNLKTNPHAPGKWRVDGPLANMPEFKAAWGCKDGDAMVRPENLRARIW